jgi:hypothetical protein
MPLPNNTAVLDPQTGFQIPDNTGTWGDLLTWGSWNGWKNVPSTTMTVVGQIQDRGKVDYFNLKTRADVTGDIAYSVYTSPTGEFGGEETVTHIEPNTENIPAFFGRYYSVVANVSDPGGQSELRNLTITSTNARFDMQYNNINTASLDSSPINGGSRVLPLDRKISAVLNMQVTVHNPTVTSSVYTFQGNTGYVLDYDGSVKTTLASQLSTTPSYSSYVAAAVGNQPTNIRVFKTTNGTEWTDVNATFANSVTGLAESITWSYDNNILVFASQDAGNNYNRIRGYSRSGDTFTKLPDPDVWPTGGVNDVEWAKTDDDYCAVAHNNSPYLTLYRKSGGNYVKQTDPSTLPTGDAFAVSWSADDSFLAVGHDESPYLTVYYRSGNTFTKLANPASLPAGLVTDCAWDPTGRWLFTTSTVSGSAVFKIYYRAGTGASSTLIALADPAVVPSASGVMSVDWHSGGNVVALGWSGTLSNGPFGGTQWGVYRVSGNTFTWANTVNSLVHPVFDVEWGRTTNTLYVAYNEAGLGESRGLEVYDFDFASNVATILTGPTSNVGNVYAISTTSESLNNYIEVVDASAFSTGNIRVRNENMTYTGIDTVSNPNRLTGVTRATSNPEFGNSTANVHALGSEVYQVANIAFYGSTVGTATELTYFATEVVGIAFAYVGDKDPTYPSVIIRDRDGNANEGTVDVIMWVLPEQYMDDINLNTR